MAANMKAVKLRIKSVESTMQITKAMELVASSKLRKASMRPTQKQHNDCWQWDFLPNRLPKLPSYLWKSLRI